MGKQNFENFYRTIKAQLEEKVTGKISYYSDRFELGKNYAGAIIYAIDGEFKWKNEAGRAKGQNCRSFYVIIQCTDHWPKEAKNRARGSGLVHDYLIQNVLGIEHSQEVQGKKRVCCGGFGYLDGKIKFSSIWLNQTNQWGCDTDGEKYLSDAERLLIKYCFEQWKNNGTNHIFEVPNFLDNQLSGYQALQMILPKEGWLI